MQGYKGSLSLLFPLADERNDWYNTLSKICIQLKIYDCYSQEYTLGKGKFAQVVLGINKVTKKKFAIKIIDKEKIENRSSCLVF